MNYEDKYNDNDVRMNKPKSQHEKYKELEGLSKKLKRDISSLFKRLRHVKKAMKKYTKCERCLKYFIVERIDLDKNIVECPYCGMKYYFYG